MDNFFSKYTNDDVARLNPMGLLLSTADGPSGLRLSGTNQPSGTVLPPPDVLSLEDKINQLQTALTLGKIFMVCVFKNYSHYRPP